MQLMGGAAPVHLFLTKTIAGCQHYTSIGFAETQHADANAHATPKPYLPLIRSGSGIGHPLDCV